MFQYAFGRALAMRTGQSVAWDTTRLEKTPNEGIALDLFPGAKVVRAELRDCRSLQKMPAQNVRRAIAKLLGKTPPLPKSLIRESTLDYDRSALDVPGDAYYDGYWQSELYFRDYASTIRSELTPPEPESPQARGVLEKVARENSCSIHVRRGDYLDQSSGALEFHGVLGSDYYARAIAELESQVDRASYFVFSNDPDWCSSNLTLPRNPTYVSLHSKHADIEEFALMSLCTHHVIGNSTFSWWAAWLGRTEPTVTIAPRTWFKGYDVRPDHRFPEDWISIE